MEILGLILTIMLGTQSTLGFQPGSLVVQPGIQQESNWSNEAAQTVESDSNEEENSPVEEDASENQMTFTESSTLPEETDEGSEVDGLEAEDASDTDLPVDSQIDVESITDPIEDSQTETDSNDAEQAEPQDTVVQEAPAVDTVLNGSDGNYYQVTEAGSEVALFKPGVEVTSLIIPDTIEVDGITYNVTSIVRDACRGNTKLKSVEIGSQVREIGRSAFHDCTKIKEIVIGENVEEIGPGAFQACKKLSSITIPANVESIDTHAFYGCKKLKEIIIESQKLTPETVGRDVWKKVSDEVTVTVPSDYLESYSEILLSSGLPDEATIQAE